MLDRLTAAQLEQARQLLEAREPRRPYLVHPADRKHLDHCGKADCQLCVAIWRKASNG